MASAATVRTDLRKQADSLNQLAARSLESNLDTAKVFADRALTRAVQVHYLQGQMEAHTTLSKIYLQKEDYLKMLDQYFQMIDLYPATDIPNQIRGYDRVTQFFFQIIKDHRLAEKYIGIMVRLSRQTTDPASRGQVYLCQAKYSLARNLCDSAILYGFLALPWYHRAQDRNLEIGGYKLLGDAFVQKKLYTQADLNYRQALILAGEAGNMAEIAILYTRIAHINQVMGNYPLTLKYNLAALRIRRKTGPPKLVSSSLLNVGEAYWLMGRKDSARYYLEQSLRLAEQIKSTDQLETVYTQLANFAREEHRYEDALKYFRTCYDYRTKMHYDRNRSEIRILDANRAIRTSEGQNELLQQETILQELDIRNRRIQILLFEVALLIMLSLILFTNTITRKNRKRKNELKELNDRLTKEIATRAEAESRLKQSEELHRFLAENSADVISLFDAQLKRLYISPSCEKFYGYTTEEMRGMAILELVEPPCKGTLTRQIGEMLIHKKSIKTICKVRRKDGFSFWAEIVYNPVSDPSTHEVKNVIAIVRDISDRIKYEEELSENSRQKEYLLREIHNRVKNNFAILVSLMNMQCDQSSNDELKDSLTELQLRVRTMSLVHEQLYQTQEISSIPFDSYLRHLTLIISSSFNNKRVTLCTETSPCNVSIEMALPLGLIINELITNAYKYAFPGERTGDIWVRLYPDEGEKFCISISDNGIGLPHDFATRPSQSMGTQIVQILVEQIEASLHVSNNSGACFRIRFIPIQSK